MDENRNLLTTHVDNVLYSLQAHFNLMSLGQLSEKGIDFNAVGNQMILHRLGKTVATGVQIGREIKMSGEQTDILQAME